MGGGDGAPVRCGFRGMYQKTSPSSFVTILWLGASALRITHMSPAWPCGQTKGAALQGGGEYSTDNCQKARWSLLTPQLTTLPIVFSSTPCGSDPSEKPSALGPFQQTLSRRAMKIAPTIMRTHAKNGITCGTSIPGMASGEIRCNLCNSTRRS